MKAKDTKQAPAKLGPISDAILELASRKFPFRVRYGHVIDGMAVNRYEGCESKAAAVRLATDKKPPKTVCMIDVEQHVKHHFDMVHRYTKKGKQWKRVR